MLLLIPFQNQICWCTVFYLGSNNYYNLLISYCFIIHLAWFFETISKTHLSLFDSEIAFKSTIPLVYILTISTSHNYNYFRRNSDPGNHFLRQYSQYSIVDKHELDNAIVVKAFINKKFKKCGWDSLGNLR